MYPIPYRTQVSTTFRQTNLSNVNEISRSIRPSAIINVYLLLTLPFDIARSRTLWEMGATRSFAALFSSAVGMKFMILLSEAMEKRGILLDRYQNSSPEATSGIYSRSFFFWLNKLMTTGFTRTLSNEDLYPIDEEMTSRVLLNQGQNAWETSKHIESDSWAVFRCTLRANWVACLSCVFPRLAFIGFSYAQPFLLTRTVAFADNLEEPDSVGWGLTAAFGLVFFGLAISNGAYRHLCYRFVTASRGTLVTMVYAKTLDLSITALDESAALTLMSNDTGKCLSTC